MMHLFDCCIPSDQCSSNHLAVQSFCPIVGSREHNNGKRDGKRLSQSIRAIAMFSTREILLAADVNLFMPTLILCSAIIRSPNSGKNSG